MLPHIVKQLLDFVLLVATMDPLSVVSAVAGLIALVAKVGIHGLEILGNYRDSVFVVSQTMTTIKSIGGALKNVYTISHSMMGKDSLEENSRKSMWHMSLEGDELFEKMFKLLEKYEDMKRSFRKQLSRQVKGLAKAEMLGGFIREYRDTVNFCAKFFDQVVRVGRIVLQIVI